jgi:hypothetical protein
LFLTLLHFRFHLFAALRIGFAPLLPARFHFCAAFLGICLATLALSGAVGLQGCAAVRTLGGTGQSLRSRRCNMSCQESDCADYAE